MTRQEAYKVLIVAIAKTIAFWPSIFGFLFLVARSFGWIPLDKSWDGVITSIGPLVVIALFFVAAGEAVFQTINQHQQTASIDFYLTNQDARRERAHYFIFHLHRQGQGLAQGALDLRQNWDREVIRTLGRIAPMLIQTYLHRTGRVDNPMVPLLDAHFESALKLLNDWLLENFHHVRL